MEKKSLLVLLTLLLTLQLGLCFEILCHHSDGAAKDRGSKNGNSKAKLTATEESRGTLVDGGRYIRCNKTSKHMVCFAVWTRPSNTSIMMHKQSCMIMNDEVCQQSSCSDSFHNSQSGYEFCCCKGRLCNGNVTQAVPVKRRETVVHLPSYDELDDEDGDYDDRHLAFTSSDLGLILGLCVAGIVVVVGTAFAIMIRRRRQELKKSFGGRPMRLRKFNGDGHRNGRLASPSNDSCGTTSTRLMSQGGKQRYSQGKLLGDFSRLQLLDLIHRGKYGEVWRSRLPSSDQPPDDPSEEVYCVKTFSRGPQQQYFHNERDIYSMTMNCNHPNVLSCFGWDVRPDGLALLVLEFCPDGSLQHYLANHTIDWESFLRLAMGATAGLAHLHSETGVPGVTRDLSQKQSWTTGDRKCPIVHRDINSRNMVVRRDGTVLISDMGFAVKLAPGGNRYYNRDNVAENAEESPLQEVGTVRYMAPEVLEGFVNLRECESSLKQVDVYALSLVLWELANRCCPLFPSGEPLPYMEPYWHEVGPQPDVGALTEIVVKQKVRPKFPQDWDVTRMPHCLLKDTLEESWDSDQEARLSAACILERLKSLSPNWQTYAESSGEVGSENVPFLSSATESQVDDACEPLCEEEGERDLVV